ncbi:hypothetical protein CVU82_02095 [Candidatus Falkowbacteria bacterium HGW-Falkowbacteria-1]|jgi:hypothetical protein|uniref:Uncharacterized protein n=1 Tax=Candidatus Falkowbacteria bacterium HGW-Falkowbacteria-1 TaxID=2013768 RepID=A0A2N2E9K9_9BACT|nr:MAG: hypothetical protein CVU82_02095 [Candidatus Falkowbacteria bacterium HGW-Falkowbacteria-1]
MNSFESLKTVKNIQNLENVVASAIKDRLNKHSDFGIFTPDNKINVDEINNLIGLFEEYPDFVELSEQVIIFLSTLIRKSEKSFSKEEREEVLSKLYKILKEGLEIESIEKKEEKVLN